jgi:phosphoribosylglycinamide formyltransferase-1
MLKLGVLISGRGSNLQALIAATQEAGYPAQIACVISNKSDAAGLNLARAAGLPALTISHRDYKDRAGFEAALDKVLADHGVQLICLAGFMRILTGWFVERWRDRLVNIHPSLLPAFPGVDTHRATLDYGARIAGCTVHYVRAEMDCGPIILQGAVPVLAGDTEDSLAARILKVEHRIYPQAVRLIAEGRVNVFDEKVFIAGDETSDAALIAPVV